MKYEIKTSRKVHNAAPLLSELYPRIMRRCVNLSMTELQLLDGNPSLQLQQLIRDGHHSTLKNFCGIRVDEVKPLLALGLIGIAICEVPCLHDISYKFHRASERKEPNSHILHCAHILPMGNLRTLSTFKERGSRVRMIEFIKPDIGSSSLPSSSWTALFQGLKWVGKVMFLFVGAELFIMVGLYFFQPETKNRSYPDIYALYANSVPPRKFKEFVIVDGRALKIANTSYFHDRFLRRKQSSV